MDVSDNARITGFKADRESPQKVGARVRLSGSAEANLKGTTYRYIVYDGSGWSDIKTSKTLEECEWVPEREGNYMLCFQLVLGGGRIINEFMDYTVKGLYTEIRDIKAGSLGEDGRIGLTADVSSTDTGLRYTYLVYDMSTWSPIIYDSASKEASWEPEKEGRHLLHLEVTGDSGKTFVYEKFVDVKDDIKITAFTVDKQSPQKLGTEISLIGKTTSPKLKGTVYRFIVYDGQNWNDIKTMDSLVETSWKPERNGNYTLCLQVIIKGGRVLNEFINFKISEFHDIMGITNTSVNQLAAYFRSSNFTYPSEVLSKGGASTLEEFCKIYIEEANIEGIKAEVAFCQSMIETGFLQYKGDVKIEQYNFAGMGAVGNGAPGNSFPDVRTGIRAHIQHLKCYATNEPLNLEKVDPRWNENLRGKAPYVEWLSIKVNPYNTGWAADPEYGEKIISAMNKVYSL